VSAIWVQPDAEFLEKEQPLIFEVPGELHRIAMNTELPEQERRTAFGRIYVEFGTVAIKEAAKHPKLAGFEVLDGHPLAMLPHEVQEDPADIVERTMKGISRTTPKRAIGRDTVFWKIVVKVRQQRRLYERFREVKGPKDGFEANDEMPAWGAHKKLVYDLKRDN